jgi:hypothetical protein
MGEPARTWLTGYGLVLVPRAPFEVARRGGDEGVTLTHHSPSGVRLMVVQPNPLVKHPEDGAPARLALGPKTSTLSDVLSFHKETRLVTSWSIVARAESDAAGGGETFRCAFPSGTTLWSTPRNVTWPFEMTTSGARRDETTYVQGRFSPSECPSLRELVGEGMRRADEGQIDGLQGKCDWLELHYVIDSTEWTQRRYIVPLDSGLVALVTSHAIAANAQSAFENAGKIVASLALSVEASSA